MDGDRERRHRPTLWARFGVAQAILAGDALIALGFEVLATDTHPAAAAATRDLGSDLRARKKSAPVAAALCADATGSTELAHRYFGTVPLEESEVIRIADLVEEAGGRAWARAEVRRHLDFAWNLVDRLDLDRRARVDLEELADTITAGER